MKRFLISRKQTLLLIILALVVFAGRTAASDGGIDFKLSGGIAKLLDRSGDLESVRKSTIAFYEFIGNQPNYTSTWNWKELAAIPNFEADIILRLGKYLGVGIGSGYIAGTSTGDGSYHYSGTAPNEVGTVTATLTAHNKIEYNLHAVPLKANLYFFMPLHALKIYGYAGAGYYLGKLAHVRSGDYSYSGQYFSPFSPEERRELTETSGLTESASCNALGFQGGLGVGWDLSSHLSVGLEIFGRSVNFKNWTGDASNFLEYHDRYWTAARGWYYDNTTREQNESHGTLWFYQSYNGWKKDYDDAMWILNNRPTDPPDKNPRPASINLNAWGISASLTVHFDFSAKK